MMVCLTYVADSDTMAERPEFENPSQGRELRPFQ